jgi:epoxyqueuosine reductase
MVYPCLGDPGRSVEKGGRLVQKSDIRAFLSTWAFEENLELLGIVALNPEDQAFGRFVSWLAQGKHADMHFLESNLHCRQDPRKLLDGARSAVVLGLPYYQGVRFSDLRGAALPKIAQYAKLKDYHKEFKNRGQRIIEKMRAVLPNMSDLSARVCVDSAPVLERALADRTELGFIGKNTCYIHPKKGSFYLLGEIVLNKDLPLDTVVPIDLKERNPRLGGCGSCRRCQVHCPTGALSQDYQLDARRCLAYYNIEHRGTIPVMYWPWFKVYLFGCDICQLVCPYNRRLDVVGELKIKVDESLDLYAIATMSQQEYCDWFGGTPMTRAKRSGLQRNALISMVVLGHQRLREALIWAQDSEDPLLLATILQIDEYRQSIEGKC